MSLEIKSTVKDNTFILSLEGVLDISTVEFFKNSLDNTQNMKEVNVDFDKLSFIDSTGISGLVQVIKFFQENNISIKIINIFPDVFEVLDILGLKEIFGEAIFEVKQN